ncbi:MAG: TetR/AcrR family transcriptional regulator [Clostridiales bacterium]|nr:TetR/AcrR family transcriptional regulator [Clostridiales bacterium]
MKPAADDRRVRKTKIAIKDALVELMQKQHISGISIRAICETADINRSTFYAHYRDQYDLLAQIEEELMGKLRHHLEEQDYSDNRPISNQVLTSILEYIGENAQLFQILLSENSDFHLQQDIMELAAIVTSRTTIAKDKSIQAYLNDFGLSGCLSVIKRWLNTGMRESPAVLAEFIVTVVYRGMDAFL